MGLQEIFTMSCSSVITASLAITGIMLSITSFYVTKMLNEEKFVVPCDISPTLSCSEFLRISYSNGFGVIPATLGNTHPANLPNSIYSMSIFSVVLLSSCSSSMSILNMVLIFSIIMLLANAAVAAISLPLMCPISLASISTMLLMMMTLLCRRRYLSEDKSCVYSASTVNNNNKQAFKKFI